MKIAVISDIHANLHALTAVVNDFNQKNVELVFALGDYAMAGPQPVETLDFLVKQPWTMIMGNTDELITLYSDDLYKKVKSAFPVMGEALKFDVGIIPDKYINFLKTLPKEKILVIDGIKIQLVHGSPRKIDENIFPNLAEETVEEMISDSDADLIFCGHTHIPCGYQLNNKKTVVNVGSVGRPMSNNATPCYVILTIENGTFAIEHVFVDYDKETPYNIIKNLSFEGSEKLADMLYNTENRHV